MESDAIRPGAVMLDTEGKPIQAHGGSIIAVDGVFYWYGENKERTDGRSRIWHWGVRCYSSTDFYHWKDEGIIIPPVLDDPTSPLDPTHMMDRPHILFNARTGKYVAWLKVMGRTGSFAVLEADSVLGPYMMLNPALCPCGFPAGDFDLAVDEQDGKGYLFSERPHQSLYCADLNDEYTGTDGYYSEHFPHAAPPATREAPAHFFRNGRHYLITSGTTGYHPNPSECASSLLWHGPYEVQDALHIGDASLTSFNSQISSVFHHPCKKDLYIALADRWLPDLPQKEGDAFWNGDGYRATARHFEEMFRLGSEFVFTEEDAKEMYIDSSQSRYVWLPIEFDGDAAHITWKDSWRIEDYD